MLHSKMDLPRKIRKLDEVVVNRIAAGEIIQRPANALKELIENSLDAKSSNIQISTKEGGLKFLQIQDNGTGIRKEDMDIVCERFTTSKLQNFDDLKSISTYGFRGEALASISHVAQLTITTKTAHEKCAYKASYVDGKLKASPAPCAGNQGTIITVENLFYNVATRRKALSSSSEENARITDVVTKYAVHNPNVGFILKKHGESATQVRTPHSSSHISNIKHLYGNNVAKDLLEIQLEDKIYKFKLHALITNANYSSKRLVLLLFINHRLVDSSSIKKTLDDMYAVYLPKKTHPWCYISLEIDPQNIDVNVHPTKHEVRFLHEDTIIERMKIALDEKLSSNDSSRTFYIQAKLPKLDLKKETLERTLSNTQKDRDDKLKKPHPKDLIRISSTDQKLDKFNFTLGTAGTSNVDTITYNKTNNKNESTNKISNEDNLETMVNINSDDIYKNKEYKDTNSTAVQNSNKVSEVKKLDITADDGLSRTSELVLETTKINSDHSKLEKDGKISIQLTENTNTQESKSFVEFKSYSANETQVETKLLSILSLRKEVEDSYHEDLRKILSELIFVGCVDESSALIQSGVNLYICNTEKLVEELFYEIMLYDFANYGVIKFSEPLQIKDLALLGLETEEAGWTKDAGPKEELAKRVQELLVEKADMLRQYFSIYIDKRGCLKSLPLLLENYFPSQTEIPLYILRLSTEVNYTKEKPCFHDICRETAMFYSKVDIFNDSWKHVTENVLYTAIKESLLPPKHFAHDSTILEIANLPDLYKIFERC